MSEKTNTPSFEVFVDDRETVHESQEWIMPFLKQHFPDINFVVKRLDEGDYASKRVIFERKTIDDLWSSLADGRFHDQINRLLTYKDHVVCYLIVGSVEAWEFKHNEMYKRGIVRKPDRDIIDGMIASLMTRYNFRVICDSNEHLGLKRMIRTMQKIEEEDVLDLPSKTDPAMFAACIVGFTKAQIRELIKRHGTSIAGWSTLTKSQLMDIHGVGPKRAEKFIRVLNDGWDTSQV